MIGRTVRSLVAGIALLAAAAGCGHSLTATAKMDVQTPGAVRVLVTGVDDDEVKLMVYNQSPYPMVIYRDGVKMATQSGVRSRQPGGLSNQYEVPPGGQHALHANFNIDGLREGETVMIYLQEALLINGQMVPVEPIPLVIK